MRKQFVRVWTCLVLMTGSCVAQPRAVAPAGLAFDVATVKLSAPLDMQKLAQQVQAGQMPNFGPKVGGSQATFNYMTVKDLIAFAYQMKPYQVTGPESMTQQRYDVTAKLPEGAHKEDAPAMLQALLKERFQLVAHLDRQEHQALALMVGKDGSKMKRASVTPAAIDESVPLKTGEMTVNTSDGPARVTRSADGTTVVNMGAKGMMTQRVDMTDKTLRIDSDGVTMAGFANQLTQVMQMAGTSGKQVVDQTGLSGYYQVSLVVSLADLMNLAKSQGMDGGGAPASLVGESDGGASVYDSVHTLGLRLQPTKAMMDQLVVDRVNKAPSEN